RNADAVERSRVIGSAKMDDKTAWAKIGELGLDKQVANTDSCSVIFGELAEKYLAKYPFNKKSTKDLYEQVIRNVLMTTWSDIKGNNGDYEIALLVATCGFRISEALGLRWRDIVWDKGHARIRQTYVHSTVQEGAKTRLSRSRVEVPHLALSVLATWKRETMYSAEDDYVFPSIKLAGKKPRTGTMLVQDYIRPAAILAGILIEIKS